MADEKFATVVNCPFCPDSPGVMVKIPGGNAYCCQNCGMTGPPAWEADGPHAEERALRMWNTRGGIGHTRIARVPPNVQPDTAIVGENLMKVAEKVLDLEYGQVDVSLVMLFSSKDKRLGLVSHRLDNAGIFALTSEVAKQAQAQLPRIDAQERKLIIPGR